MYGVIYYMGSVTAKRITYNQKLSLSITECLASHWLISFEGGVCRKRVPKV